MPNSPATPIRLYGMRLSGHSHRVELCLSLLALPFDRVEVDLLAGEHKRPEFIARNSFGQVPVIEDGDVTLADSNAILVYLAGRYAAGRWMPADPLAAAQVQRWFSVASGPLAFGPAAARVIHLFGRPEDPAPAIGRAHQLLKIMEGELAGRPWLAGAAPTLADIANYSYVASAPEGGVALDAYPAVREWLARLEALPGFVPMPRSAVGLWA